MTRTPRFLALITVLTLAIAACGTEAPIADGDPAAPDVGDGGGSSDGDWLLVSGTVDGAAMNLDPDWQVTMLIEGSTIGGRAACNSYGGDIVIDGSSFSVGDIFMTEMGCEPQIHEVESAFATGLFKADQIVFTETQLRLTGEGVEFVFEPIAPVPTSDLVGTTWILDSLIQGDAVSSTYADAEEATLVLNADGTFSGSTGCRTISGEYVVNGGTLQFPSWGADGECPSGLTEQDNAVISVLEGPLRVEINGDRLTLTTQGAEGLSFRAG